MNTEGERIAKGLGVGVLIFGVTMLACKAAPSVRAKLKTTLAYLGGTAAGGQFLQGDTVQIKLTVTNTGSIPAINVLPGVFIYDPAGGWWAYTNWFPTDIAAGSSIDFIDEFVLAPDAAVGDWDHSYTVSCDNAPAIEVLRTFAFSVVSAMTSLVASVDYLKV